MGNELGHFREWDEKTQLDWNLLEYPKHDSFFHFFRKLSEFYHNMPELYATDFDNRSFKWLEVNAPKECVYAFIREFNNHSGIVTVLNLSDKNHKNFRIGCENSLTLTQIINTDNYKWGGNTPDSDGTEIHTENIPHKDNSYSFNIDIPAFSGILFKAEF
ncbi:MAG: alpha amylase C-terminal domain-containing protein [Oscillospiraceae bacterium]|jgi:1,4-alpha-glucan branching enzyme|nr:alpha amylase C-terminal domain-containing protein [Oscillospiraceae bacterium]